MYTNNTFNSPQIFYTKRRNNSNLKAYNIKKILCLNPFNLNSKSPKDNINTNEYKNINDYSDIAYFETKQKIDLMKFKIGKFKSFLDKAPIEFANNIPYIGQIAPDIPAAKVHPIINFL